MMSRVTPASIMIVPALEESDFDVDELAVFVLGQRRNNRVQDVLHAGILDGVVQAHVVLVYSFEPAEIKIHLISIVLMLLRNCMQLNKNKKILTLHF